MLANILVATGLFLTITGTTWYLGNAIGSLQTAVDDIKNNHLHTLNGRISRIESLLMERK